MFLYRHFTILLDIFKYFQTDVMFDANTGMFILAIVEHHKGINRATN
jgi:hypothetical protein